MTYQGSRKRRANTMGKAAVVIPSLFLLPWTYQKHFYASKVKILQIKSYFEKQRKFD